jgi:hypothetical protein
MVVKVRPKVIIIMTTADDYIYRDVMDYGVYRDVMWLLPNLLTARLACWIFGMLCERAQCADAR